MTLTLFDLDYTLLEDNSEFFRSEFLQAYGLVGEVCRSHADL